LESWYTSDYTTLGYFHGQDGDVAKSSAHVLERESAALLSEDLVIGL
jgi:hypothetical protein